MYVLLFYPHLVIHRFDVRRGDDDIIHLLLRWRAVVILLQLSSAVTAGCSMGLCRMSRLVFKARIATRYSCTVLKNAAVQKRRAVVVNLASWPLVSIRSCCMCDLAASSLYWAAFRGRA